MLGAEQTQSDTLRVDWLDPKQCLLEHPLPSEFHCGQAAKAWAPISTDVLWSIGPFPMAQASVDGTTVESVARRGVWQALDTPKRCEPRGLGSPPSKYPPFPTVDGASTRRRGEDSFCWNNGTFVGHRPQKQRRRTIPTHGIPLAPRGQRAFDVAPCPCGQTSQATLAMHRKVYRGAQALGEQAPHQSEEAAYIYDMANLALGEIDTLTFRKKSVASYHQKGPMALIMDGESASATVSFAGAFQATTRGPVLGEACMGPAQGTMGNPFLVRFPESGIHVSLSTAIYMARTPMIGPPQKRFSRTSPSAPCGAAPMAWTKPFNCGRKSPPKPASDEVGLVDVFGAFGRPRPISSKRVHACGPRRESGPWIGRRIGTTC